MNKDKLMAATKTILKRTNLRVYPTKVQELVLSQSFGNSRFIWNYYVSIFLNKRGESELTLIQNKKLSKGIDLT